MKKIFSKFSGINPTKLNNSATIKSSNASSQNSDSSTNEKTLDPYKIISIFKTKTNIEDSKKITKTLINNPLSIDRHNTFMNETDRTIVALLWHENIIDVIDKHPIQKSFPFYSKILDNMCFADYIDRITFQNQIWQFNEMSSMIKTFYNNKIYHELRETMKNKAESVSDDFIVEGADINASFAERPSDATQNDDCIPIRSLTSIPDISPERCISPSWLDAQGHPNPEYRLKSEQENVAKMEENIEEIRFTKVLTKYSTEYNNQLFIYNMCQELDMDKKDMIAFFQELRLVYGADFLSKPEITIKMDEMFENYNINKLDIKRIYRYLDKNVKKESCETEFDEEDENS